MRKPRNYFSLVLKILISLAILSVLIYQSATNPHVLELVQKPKRWDWFALALLAQTVGYTLSHLRWWLLANAVQVKLSLWQSIRIGYIALAFHLIAFGVAGGDILRAFYVCRDHPENKSYAVASVILDRAIGLLTMFGCVAVASFFVDWQALAYSDPQLNEGLSSGLRIVCLVSQMVSVAGFAGLACTLMFGGSRWVDRAKGRAGSLPGGKILTSIVDVVVLYRRQLPAMFTSFLLSLGVVASLSLCVFCLAKGLTDQTPTLGQHYIITPISLIAGAVPLPMGIGSQELAMKLLYQWFATADINTDYGLLVAMGYRLITFILMAVGVAFYFWQGREMRQQMEVAMESHEMQLTE